MTGMGSQVVKMMRMAKRVLIRRVLKRPSVSERWPAE
jgi:hypothetical protein